MTLKLRSLLLATAVVLGTVFTTSVSQAQTAILAEMYGRGVHAYYAGNHADAHRFLSLAIDNGLQDPRAYYFRGLVAAASGRPEDAEADWKRGAELEATGRINAPVGTALARFQGPERLKLEGIRQQAKLEALARATERSEARYGEIEAAGSSTRPPAAPASPRPASPAPQDTATRPVAPPPAPPAAAEANPFADDLDLSPGEPRVESTDAFGDVLDNVPAETPPATEAAPAAGETDPFGAPPAAASDDPFGAPPAAGDADPFGTGGDPFGG